MVLVGLTWCYGCRVVGDKSIYLVGLFALATTAVGLIALAMLAGVIH
jgi:hypothetical protein